MSDEEDGPEWVCEPDDERLKQNPRLGILEEGASEEQIADFKNKVKATARARFVFTARSLGQESTGYQENIEEYIPKYETYDSWHTRMLGLLGARPTEQMKNLPILEVVEPGWRSEEA